MTPEDHRSPSEAAGPSLPRIRFLSLFVPDLEAAARVYAGVFGVAPVDDHEAPDPHPYAPGRPVVFDLGGVKLALYACDQRTTHPGDVGIGVCVHGSAAEIADRVAPHGGRVFHGPQPLAGNGRELAVFVLPDRHFFEVVGAAGD